jgi:hypothetical protein
MLEAKYADIPFELQESLRSIPQELRDAKFLYGAAAGLAVKYYLGSAFSKQPTTDLLRLGQP